jgi:hypothetical protein
MRTPAQKAASRANAARSTGPQTPAGKRIASRNNVKHGLLAKAIVLDNESLRGFYAMVRDNYQCLNPRNPFEESAVDEICSAEWRLRRLWSMERKAFNLEMASQPSSDEPARLVGAFDSLASGRPHFLLLHRYENRLHNIIQRSFNRLLLLRKCGIPYEAGDVIETTTKGPETTGA